MKKIYFVITSILTILTFRSAGQYEADYVDSVIFYDSQVNFDNGLVLQETLDGFIGDIITKVTPDISGDIKTGTNIGLKLNDDETEVAIQGAFRRGNHIFGGAISKAVEENIANFYDDANGFDNNFGLSLNYSYVFKRTANMKFFRDENASYMSKRKKLKLDLIYENYDFFTYLNTFPGSVLKTMLDSMAALKANNPFDPMASVVNGSTLDDLKNRTRLVAKYDSIMQLYKIILGDDLDITSPNEIRTAIGKYVKDRYVAFETKEAVFNGYSFFQVNANALYKKKSYTSYDASASAKFNDIKFNNFTVSAGLSFYYNVKHAFIYSNLTAGIKSDNSFEIKENKEKSKDYQVNEPVYLSADSIINKVTDQKAFNVAAIRYNEFNTWFANFQFTSLFTEKKNFGFTLNTQYAHSFLNENRNNLDIGIGPTFAFTDADNENVSKLNLTVFFGMSDIINQSNDARYIKFILNIPLSIVNLN